MALLLLAGWLSILAGVTMDYDITSLGLHVADLKIVRDVPNRTVRVYVTSKMSNAIFPELDNQYLVHYDSQYRPLEYSRIVDQGKTQDNVKVVYDHTSGMASATHTGPLGTYKYSLVLGERDFFSTLVMICDTAPGTGTYVLDANGKAWNASITIKGTSKLKSAIGKSSCREYQILLQPRTKEKVPYVDMVTHNLFKDKNKVSLWITNDGIPVKAVVKMGLLSMKWSIKRILK